VPKGEENSPEEEEKLGERNARVFEDQWKEARITIALAIR